MLTHPDNHTIYTAYSTQFQPTSKQEQRGAGTGASLLILSATNAYIVDHESINAELHLPKAPSTSAVLRTALRTFYFHPPPIRLPLDVVGVSFSPTSSSSSKTGPKRQRTDAIQSKSSKVAEGKSKRVPRSSVKTQIPMMSLYHEHFHRSINSTHSSQKQIH